MSETPPILWEPDAARIERATITHYARWLADTGGVRTEGYHDLWRWSVTELEAFWSSIWDFFGVRSSQAYGSVVDSRSMPGAHWFPRARLNYAAHAYRNREPDTVAIRHASELRPLRETTWGELEEATRLTAAALRASGVGPGDRVVAYMPNIVETVVAFHACASLGAVWSSCSPDFGVKSVVDRFAQIEPRVLLAVDGYRYGGRDHDRLDVVRALQQAMPTLERTVVLGYLDDEPRLDRLEHATGWDDFLAEGDDEALGFAQVGFEHPLWVLYSSGTTGLPKAIVQGHGGILLEHLKTLHLHARPPARGSALLVHDDRLDDVELRRRGTADRRLDRPLRRQPGTSRPRHALEPRGGGRRHVLRDVRRVHRGLHQGRRRASRRPDAVEPDVGRVDGVAALAGGVRLGVRRPRARHVALLDVRRHGRLHGASSAASRRSRCTGASCRPGRSARRWRPGRRTACPSSTRSASS